MLNTKTEILKNSTMNSMISENNTSVDNCDSHDRIIECFCTNCLVPICAQCLMFGDHKGHSVSTLEEGKEDIFKIFVNENKLGLFDSKIMRNDKMALEHTFFVCEEKRKLLKNEVEKIFAKIKKYLDSREEEIKKNIDDKFSEIGSKIEEKKKTCISDIKKIEEICNLFESKENDKDIISFLKFSPKFYKYINDLKKVKKPEDIAVPEELEKIFHFKREKHHWNVTLEEMLLSIRTFIDVAKFKNYEIKI